MRRGSKIDDILSLIFILLAVAAGVCFFVVNDRMAFWAVGGVAVVFRLIQYALRFFN
jgi:hypothetical protein